MDIRRKRDKILNLYDKPEQLNLHQWNKVKTVCCQRPTSNMSFQGGLHGYLDRTLPNLDNLTHEIKKKSVL